MSRRNTFYYWLFHALAAFVVVFFHVTLTPYILLWGLHPLSVLFVPAIVATYTPLHRSAIYSGILGIVCDLLAPGPIPFFYLLTYLLIALNSHFTARRLQPTLPCSLAVCIEAWCITGLMRLFLLSLRAGFAPAAAGSILLRELIISLPAMVVIHYLFFFLRKRLPPPRI